jgi:hypothetical protein
MEKRYPFKFLDAYTREDSDFFFGRTDEIEALYEMVFQTDLLLVYGASGTGKTSLIQCGLASKFQSHDWLALHIRRGSNLNTSLEKALQDAGGVIEEGEQQLDWLEEDWTNDTTMAAPTKTLSPLARRFKTIYLKHFKPIYLIFDQFEELYILGNKEEQNQFILTIKEILLVEQPVKIIISIREEYLGFLYEFERAVPELLRKKLRVEPMNLDKVETVVKSISESKQSNVHLKRGEEDAIAEGIFAKIRGDEKTLSIQLPYLQVFLDKLYLQVTAGDERREADAELSMKALETMGDIGDVLRNFLDEQVLLTAQKLVQQPTDIWRILSPFVTLEGTKEPLSELALRDRLPEMDATLIAVTLRTFVNSRIVRYAEDKELYEIAHDSLARQIHDKRTDEEIAQLEVQRLIQSQIALKPEAREYFTEKQLALMEPYLEKFRLSEEELEWIRQSQKQVVLQKEAAGKRQKDELAKTQKRLRSVIGLLLVAVLALVAAGYFAWWANQKAAEAEQANGEAQKSLETAYQSDIQRMNTEIAIAKRNLASYRQFHAENDVIQLEEKRMDSLSKQVIFLKAKIESLQQ